MTVSQRIIAMLWWGPFRRPFEAVTRRAIRKRTHVLFGPMRGAQFSGGLSHALGIYELYVQNNILANLRAGQVFYDIGANLGYLTLLAAKRVGPKGHVYAFEPFPTNSRHLHRVVSDNQLSNCTIVSAAISNCSGTAKLHCGSEAEAATPSLVEAQGSQVLEVRTLTLDEFTSENYFPSLIKLDVEGAESLVFEGAKRLLRRPDAPAWIIEIHSRENDEAISAALESNGYSSRKIVTARPTDYPRHVFARKVKR